jgi:hypothetical protein
VTRWFRRALARLIEGEPIAYVPPPDLPGERTWPPATSTPRLAAGLLWFRLEPDARTYERALRAGVN